MAGYLPTWVGILLAVGGAEMSVRHGYGGGVGYEWLALGSFQTVYEILIFINRAPSDKVLLQSGTTAGPQIKPTFNAGVDLPVLVS